MMGVFMIGGALSHADNDGGGEPEVRLVGFTEDEFGSGGVLELEVRNVPIGAELSVEQSQDVGGLDPWGAIEGAPQIVESVPALMAVYISDALMAEYFRVVCVAPRAEASANLLRIGDGAELDDVILALNRAYPGQEFSFQPFYDPDGEPGGVQDPTAPGDPALPGGDYSFLNADDLAAQLRLEQQGLRLLQTPPVRDDGGVADRDFPPTKDDQGTVDEPRDLPGDGGEGLIDEGWNGDNIRALPVDGKELDPGLFDMPFKDPELPGDNGGDLERVIDVPPTSHLRLLWSFSCDRLGRQEPGFPVPAVVTPVSARLNRDLDAGDGLLGGSPAVPGPSSYVTAVFGPDGAIEQVTTLFDPLQVRVYNNEPDTGPGKLFPLRGSHSPEICDEAVVSSLVPLPNGDPNDDLAGRKVVLLRLTRAFPGGENILTPEVVQQYLGSVFVEVASASGEEIISLIGKPVGGPLPRAVGTSGPATVTTLHRSGSNGSKWNIAIIGEGFTTASQDTFNNYVDTVILDMFRNRDIHPEILNGINLFRVNTFALDNGVTQVNSSGTVTLSRRTALDYRFSGNWNRCWMEGGPNTGTLINNLVDSVCPQADQTIIVLNESSFGGCAGGTNFTITRGVDWTVVAHEFGHFPGGQGDEYQCSQGSSGCGCYGGGEPGAPNLTSNTNRNTLEWRQWIPPWRPIPTAFSQVADTTQDAGVFAGGTIGQNQWWNCIYRPSWRGRMNNNTPEHNPRGYTMIRDNFRQYQEGNLRKCETGDFNGDGFSDLVLLDGRQISLYLAADRDVGPDDPVRGSPPRSVTGVLEPTWYNTDFIRNAAETRSWQTRPGDRHVVGDFDGDGNDDIYVINLGNWNKEYVGLLRSFGDHFEPVARYDDNLPGWQMRPGDQFYSCDFNNDGRDDLLVYNGTDWSIPYFGMLRSTGGGLAMSRRYDQYLPGWEMGRNEQFHIGDFNNDQLDDVVAFDPRSWSQVHFRVYTSNGSSLSLRDRWYGTVDVPGPNWQMRREDRVYPLDFNADGTTDIAFFNGRDWGPVYLGLYAVDDGSLNGVRRYNTDSNPLPGWQMQRRDRHWVADVDGDGDQDLVVYNKDNWSTQYLGMLRSNGDSALTGSWQDDWVGSWNLGSGDNFKVADFRGSAGWDDLFVFNSGWFGLLRSYQNRYVQETLYRKWIHNHRYHQWGWW